MSCVLFDRFIRAALCGPYFQQRVNGTGEPQSLTLVMVSAALRLLAYSEATDRVDEYVRMSECSVNETVHRFSSFVIDKFQPVYLGPPNRADFSARHEGLRGRWLPGVHGGCRLLPLGVGKLSSDLA